MAQMAIGTLERRRNGITGAMMIDVQPMKVGLPIRINVTLAEVCFEAHGGLKPEIAPRPNIAKKATSTAK
jgi:hypothetical protein